MRKPKPSDLWLGFLSAALGFFFFLLSLGVFPGEGSDPWWLLSLAGLLFFFGGIFVFANHYRKKVELISSIMLALFSLISFGIGVFMESATGMKLLLGSISVLFLFLSVKVFPVKRCLLYTSDAADE